MDDRAPGSTGRLAGKAAVIAGAGSGIGRAMALLFAHAGADVAVLDRDSSGAEETIRLMAPEGGNGIPVLCDVSQEQAVALAIAKTVKLFGRLDVLVNNAAVELALPITETTADQWDAVQAVNLKGVFFCCKEAIPFMRNADGGSIVNIASANALVGVPSHAAYSAAKGGMISLTRQLALDYGPANIRVNCICPTTTVTPMVLASVPKQSLHEVASHHPLRRICEPEDVAYAALFLASEESRCITGVVLPVDAGWTAQ